MRFEGGCISRWQFAARLGSTLVALAAIASSGSAQKKPFVSGTWTQVSGVPNISAYNPLLLTDGTVLIQDGDATDWWKLSPDIHGNYATGTWTKLPSTSGYGPLYYASQVLVDGRVFTMGGEYNNGSGTIWQNTGYIYDPVANAWSSLAAPNGWANIGDMGSVTLPSGKVLCADPFGSNAALFDPTTNSFTSPYGTGKADGNDEEGLTLLPNGEVLCVDCVDTPNSELFNPTTLRWTTAGAMPANCVDPTTLELGPAILRPDGTVIQFGASAHNCIYNTKTGTWTQGPDFPNPSTGQLSCGDAPACLLTNGNVLVQTSAIYSPPSVFFEWDGTTLNPVNPPMDAAGDPSFVGSMLMLPTGQVLYTDLGPDVLLYTPSGTYNSAWAPTITNAPGLIKEGASYTISGTQFNGLSGNSAYGDDEQNQTNYPQIRITNTATGHVYYGKEYNPSTMAVATGSQIVSTNFNAPTGMELGAATLQVVVNGIPSAPVNVLVTPAVQATSVEAYQGVNPIGTVQDIWTVDGIYYSLGSLRGPIGTYAAVEADFFLPGQNIGNLKVSTTLSAAAGATGFVYAYDWVAQQFVELGAGPLTAAQTSLTASGSAPFPRFVGSNGEVRIVVRALVPPRYNVGAFRMYVDAIQLASF